MSSGACCRCVDIREHFPFLPCLTLTLLQPPQPLLDSLLPDVSPCLSLCCFVMVISGCVEWRPYFPVLSPLKRSGLLGLQLTRWKDGTCTTTQWEPRWLLDMSFSFIYPTLTSSKPILLHYLHLQVKVDIFTLTSVFLVCIFLKTMLVFYVDSGGPVTLLVLCTALTEINSKKHSISVWVWVGSYVRRVKRFLCCWMLVPEGRL